MKENQMATINAKKWAQTEYARDLERLKQTKMAAAKRVGASMTNKEFMAALLRDARHYCDLKGLDFGSLDKQAHQEYLKDLS
jgi:hypothetical protein